MLKDDFIKSRNNARISNKIIPNPHFWKKSEFVSLDYIDKYGNIVYSEKQPGTDPTFKYHVISVAYPYHLYKPYHDRWMLPINREKTLQELGI